MQEVSFKSTDDLPASGILTTTPLFQALQGQQYTPRTCGVISLWKQMAVMPGLKWNEIKLYKL